MANPRLEELRQVLRAECISYGELLELQSLAFEIDPWDVELLEAAGVSEQMAKVRRVIAEHGGWESFLNWCEATTTDIRFEFDVTDSEFAELHAEGRDDQGRCPASRNMATGEWGVPSSECPWCSGRWDGETRG